MSRHPISQLLRQPSLRVLGINTGTSIDGLDLALVEIGEAGPRRTISLKRTASYPFPRGLRLLLRGLAEDESVEKRAVSQAHYRLGRWMAQCVLRFRDALPRPGRIDLIGCHGQTIGHFPSLSRTRLSRGTIKDEVNSATWQIGSTAVIARRTGIVSIGDFRAGDIAAGGMGAPLSGYYHYLLFGANHVVLNLGGIANVSAARGRGRRLEILAFDIGPGNMVADAIASRVLGKAFDRDGRMAAAGEPDLRIVERATRHPFFRRRPPKTCGREDFGWATVRSWYGSQLRRPDRAAVLLASAVAISAGAVAEAVGRWVAPFTRARSMVLCGGGSKNRALVRALRDRLSGWEIADTGQLGIPPQYVEPAGFAVLAYETLHARPGNRGGATGGAPAVLGSISLPRVEN